MADTVNYLTDNEIRLILNKIQPHYDELCSKYSKSYLQGSIFYLGDNLIEWWDKCDRLRYYRKNINKIMYVIHIIMENKRNLKDKILLNKND